MMGGIGAYHLGYRVVPGQALHAESSPGKDRRPGREKMPAVDGDGGSFSSPSVPGAPLEHALEPVNSMPSAADSMHHRRYVPGFFTIGLHTCIDLEIA
jgi:hypothetical protein